MEGKRSSIEIHKWYLFYENITHAFFIGEKLRLSAICQAYCYNSYCKQEKLAKSGF